MTRKPYQPTKCISNYDEEFLVATSLYQVYNRMLNCTKKPISAIHLNKFFLD